MTPVTRATDRTAESEVRLLETEYFAWVNTQLHSEFGITLDVARMLNDDLSHMELYFPPDGGLFLARHDGNPVGMVCLAKLNASAGQLRRMYVQPEQRRHGLGRALCEAVIQQARAIGYERLLLDSPRSWKGAHALYKALGFAEIARYPESEVPNHLQDYWIYMQLTL